MAIINCRAYEKRQKYTLQDIDNLVFKSTGSGDNKTGWGAYWTYMSDGKAYVYDKPMGLKNGGNINAIIVQLQSGFI